MREPAAALLSNLVLTLKVIEIRVLSIEEEIKILAAAKFNFKSLYPAARFQGRQDFKVQRDFEEIWYIRFACTIDFVGVAWAWSTLSELIHCTTY